MKKRKILTIPMFITIYVCLIGICVLLDQLTKFWIFEGLLSDGKSVKVLGDFLIFTPVRNEGAAFGLGQQDGANIIFFVITIVGTPLFAYLLWRSRKRSVCGQVGFAFIVGGTIGNAIDRAYFEATAQFFSGKVRDFIKFSFFPPVFNVADSFLTIGVVLAILAIVFLDSDSLLATIKKERKDKATASNDAVSNVDQNKESDSAGLASAETLNNTDLKNADDVADGTENRDENG
ncbi:MAG: signal peptidase II [Corallococcus sp.]|nr:signal peptidase II [Corallococcus sp.]MCM1359431.1 signal peptidase II [Corallococcus sp.]MCM1394757.1 signal peptidase II [Corallococcus sp.]